MIKKVTLFLIPLISIASCGGGGGGGSAAAPAPTTPTAPTYTYTKINDDLTNYSWDALGTGFVVEDLATGNYSWNGGTIYLEEFTDTSKIGFFGYDNYSLDVTATEKSASEFNLSYSGTTTSSAHPSVSLNLNFNSWNTTEIELYEYGRTTPSFSTGSASFADAEATFFTPQIEYLSSLGIDYVNAVQLSVSPVLEDYLLPTIYGDFTESGDMPSGSDSINFSSISYYFEQDYDSQNKAGLAVTGAGNLSIDHSNNTLNGSITFDNWMVLDQFLIGNGPNAQYTSIPNKTLTITNGQIVGSKFTADIILDDTTNSDVYIIGWLSGGFFGPNASEIGASFVFTDAGDNSADFYFGGGFLLGE